MTLVDAVNVLTALHDAVRRGQALAAWEPITWEATSGVAELFACPIIYAALRLAPPGRRTWAATLPIHVGASMVFSALHVGLMMALRIAVYSAQGFRYHVEAGAAPYEYRKDLLAYIVLGSVFYVLAGRRQRSPQEADLTSPPSTSPTRSSETFDVVEGARTIRVRLDEIIALHAAGNYVEILLEDGRRPLMRATLRGLEQRLGECGFERTHRSWLVNALHIRELLPAGSGDYDLILNAGVTAPLSRRFADALDRLRCQSVSG
ncbi:MAG: LytTR family DNA-binding domain-containing protein [Caulobacteraceae bacterium]